MNTQTAEMGFPIPRIGVGVLLFWGLGCLLFASWAQAGEVVTEEIRVWAKAAIAQEETFDVEGARHRLAVLYFQNQTDFSELDLLQKGLTLMLITDLSKVPHLEIVERIKLQALVEELKLGVSGLVRKEKAPIVGRLLGAGLLIGGQITKTDAGSFQVRSDVLSVADKSALGSPTVNGILVAELFQMEKDLLFKIVELLKVELTPRLRESLNEPITEDLEALLRLFKGIQAADEKAYDEASEFFGEALERDPGLTAAIGSIRDIYKEENGGFEPGSGSWRIPWDPKPSGDSSKPCAAERNKILRSLPRGF